MSEANLEKWHAHIRGEIEGGLDTLLADDVVFYSPVVFTPQEGKEITKLYLGAAGATLGTELLLSGGAWAILRGQGRAPRVAGSHWIRGLAVFAIAVLLSAALRAFLTP